MKERIRNLFLRPSIKQGGYNQVILHVAWFVVVLLTILISSILRYFSD